MPKIWMLLTCLLLLGSAGTSQAHPLDSPDIVYIDGMPCNSACQSYMAWSRKQTSSMSAQPAAARSERRSSYAAARRATAMHREGWKSSAHASIARQNVPLPPAKVAEPPAKIAELQPAANAAAEPPLSNVVAAPAAGGTDAGSTPAPWSIQEQVAAATALAERVTAATAVPAPQQQANNAGGSGGAETAQPSDAEQTESPPPNGTDLLVALLIARPETKSVSDLTGKDIAIEDRQSASSGTVRTAIAAAGASEVQLSESHAKPIDRLIGGEVPAAVLTLVSAEAAEWFPDIKGFKVFRIPLSPRSLKARL
jgi:hypothetical protein